jgi:hypothetical protein
MSMGLPDPGKTYSNFEEANKYSWGTVCAIQEMIGEAATHDLLPEFGFDPLSYAIGYDYSDVQELQESEDVKAKRIVDVFLGSLITQNEARDEIGYEADPDGDRYFFEIQASLGKTTAEGVRNAQPPSMASPSANGDGRKRWEY